MRQQQFLARLSEPLSQSRRLGRNIVGAGDHGQPGVFRSSLGKETKKRHRPMVDQLERPPGHQLLDILGQVAAGQALVDLLMAGELVEFLDPGFDVVLQDPVRAG